MNLKPFFQNLRDQGLTHSQIARDLDLPRQTIHYHANKELDYTLDMINKIIKAYDLNPRVVRSWLFK